MPTRHKFSDQDEEAIRAATSTIVLIMLPHAKNLAEVTARAPFACLSSMLRPYIDEAVTPRKVKREVDNRTRLWSFKIYFWDVSEGMQRGELIAETEIEKARGFNKLSQRIRQCVMEIHANDWDLTMIGHEFSEVALQQRLGGMRPAITRGSGSATMRVYYKLEDKNYLCQVDISRF